ncbi:hypothetical protein C8J57DRAFT_1257267 [Mycena rebaudengoi]|nr:hypothetical protein C8J57DRAFT_1257267 [Mycena rebaudengoi]
MGWFVDTTQAALHQDRNETVLDTRRMRPACGRDATAWIYAHRRCNYLLRVERLARALGAHGDSDGGFHLCYKLVNECGIYSPDEPSQKIIGSNELSLSAIKVTRFRKNKRSDEVTKKATTRCGVGFSNAPYLREMRATINGERRREVFGSRGRTQGRWARWTWWSYVRLLRLARARRTIRERVLAAREVQREWRDLDFGADNAARGVHGVGPREVGVHLWLDNSPRARCSRDAGTRPPLSRRAAPDVVDVQMFLRIQSIEPETTVRDAGRHTQRQRVAHAPRGISTCDGPRWRLWHEIWGCVRIRGASGASVEDAGLTVWDPETLGF